MWASKRVLAVHTETLLPRPSWWCLWNTVSKTQPLMMRTSMFLQGRSYNEFNTRISSRRKQNSQAIAPEVKTWREHWKHTCMGAVWRKGKATSNPRYAWLGSLKRLIQLKLERAAKNCWTSCWMWCSGGKSGSQDSTDMSYLTQFRQLQNLRYLSREWDVLMVCFEINIWFVIRENITWFQV